jgi:hypothetical protein
VKVADALLLCNHAFGGGHQTLFGILRAKGGELLGLGLELVGLEDGCILFIGVVAVEPYGQSCNGFLRELDEVLALDGGKIDRLPIGRICGDQACNEEGCGNLNSVCSFQEHLFLLRAWG